MAKKEKIKVGDDVRVYWDDAASSHPEAKEGPWNADDTALVTSAKCRTLGIVASIDKEVLVVVQTMACDGGYTADFAIPRGCITLMEKV